MTAECTQRSFEFHGVGGRQVTARFDGGEISSDGGALLLRMVEGKLGIVRDFAACFKDHRDPRFIEHTVDELVAQRVFGLALGYEDLNDHDDLRRDRLLAVAVGKKDIEGGKRRGRDQGRPLAGRNTLNRLELTREGSSASERYKKIELDFEAVDHLLVQTFLRSFGTPPKAIVLDLDATNDPLHGKQEGRFFHGYYDEYCYLPLYIFCDDHLLCARLRRSNIDASAGTLIELAGIVEEIRAVWPDVHITIRADSGFCRDEIMSWCDENRIHYVIGLARNARLERRVKKSMRKAKVRQRTTGEAVRIFQQFKYRTKDTWSRSRRVVAKAEALKLGENPRFIVTSYSSQEFEAKELYEKVYCARGEMENRIKEQKNFLFADRTSTHWMRSNQIRVYLSAIAYVLMSALRRLALIGTDFAQAQCDTIRLRLLKIGARITITCRRVWVSFATGFPFAALFATVYDKLRVLSPR